LEECVMPYASVNGVELYYESHGEGPALLFYHGMNGNHLAWWQQVPAFMDRYRVITMDMRGFGLSKLQPNQPGANAFIDDLEGLLDHLDIDQLRLVGFSMSGSPALGFAARHPHRMRALIMVGTTGGFVTEGMAKHIQEAQQQRPADEDPVLRSLAKTFPEREPALTFLYREIATLNPQRGEDFMSRGTRPSPPTVEQLQNLRVPTLFIVGDEDRGMPLAAVEEMQSYIPNSQLRLVKGSGHNVAFDQAAMFNSTLASFLAMCD
jgi:pimeloyl-ACP methyl ester carboxylesterase